ncbi:MAG: amidase domain-containing protein [Bifidobacterium mongoliense]|jgi:hypothetical protein|uniref:amidase domain-containing protein n=1 Tax=Bifidobacterium mongoliense TaxID=518643 RepID=UPI002F35050F
MQLRKISIAAFVAASSLLLITFIPQTALAENVGRTTLAASIRAKINRKVDAYRQLLEASYNSSALDASAKTESDKLLLASPPDQQIAKGQTSSVIESFTTSGLSIDRVSVKSSIKSISKTGPDYAVKADITPTVFYQRIDENQDVVHSSCWWTDQHEITVSGQEEVLQNKSSRLAASPSVTGDVLVPEPLADPETSLSNIEHTERGLTTAQALSRRKSLTQPRFSVMAGATPTLPNYMDGVRYALKWTAPPYNGDAESDYNLAHPYSYLPKDNCANFVSQSIHAAGAPLKSGLTVNTKDPTVWTPDLVLGKPTWTWANAQYNYNYMKTNYYKAYPDPWLDMGSLIYADWNSDGTKDHMMIVTQADRSFLSNGTMVFNTYISQKTNNRHNIPLSVEMSLASKTHSNITWYGLVIRWTPWHAE